MDKETKELDVNKLIYNPLLKAIYGTDKADKYPTCFKEKEDYTNCLIKMQKSGRRKWGKECFKYESALLNCINEVKMQKLREDEKRKEEEMGKVKARKPNEQMMKQMEEEFSKQRKFMEEKRKKK
eukprot:TRINITY_DN14565_c0_g1_i1.p2 TRINITY_DN14565_c0_g1~~TRINITY_DN14565_c0_g1_i1.p2  ORF type:complete len:125 (-),score=69.53 TRINITY_DN14565_c0_g1_i1:72-446(-)